MKIYSSNWIWLLCGLVFFIFDRIIKQLFYQGAIRDSQFISYTQNSGIAFGIGIPISLGIFFYVLIILILFSLVYALIYYLHSKTAYPAIAVWVILLGSASNLIDRIRHGFVIDYINLHFWPVFNISDMLIVVGVILLAVKILKSEKI